MPISEIDIQLIEKHLEKSLSETEQATFNQRLNDADFAAEVQLYQKSVHAIHALGDSKLKIMLQQLEEEAPPQYNSTFIPKVTRRFYVENWVGLAAAFLILVGVGYWYLTLNKNDYVLKDDKVFAYFEPYKNFEKPTVRDDETKNTLEKAYSLYDNGDYAQSLTYFEKIAPPQYLDESGQFFEANAYLATRQIEKAIPILEKLSQDTASKWQQHAEWYLALALSKTQKEQATRLFEKIKNDASHPHQNKAAKVKLDF